MMKTKCFSQIGSERRPDDQKIVSLMDNSR